MSTYRSVPFRAAVVARAVAAAVLCAALPGGRGAGAQPATPPPAAAAERLGPYERALRLVESGYGAEARALTDSLVAATLPGSPVLGEALWWRAALAADAAGSERDLRRLMSEVPGSPRVGPAAVRLAQLALLRERPDDAAALLEPVARGQAGEPARGLAGYWLARARLARRDAAGACAALTAAAGPAAVDADLTRQLATLRQRVPDCGGAVVAVGPSGTTGTAAAPVAGGAPSPAPRPGAPRATSEPTPPREVPADAPAPTVPTQRDVATAASAPPGGSTPAAAPPARPRSGEAEPDRTAAPPRPAPLAAAPVGRGGFSVQVAAYDTRAGADALTTQLRASGLDAFTEGQGPDGQAPPFRVKVGRHATRAAALEELAALRGRGVTGFVTSARPAAASGTR